MLLRTVLTSIMIFFIGSLLSLCRWLCCSSALRLRRPFSDASLVFPDHWFLDHLQETPTMLSSTNKSADYEPLKSSYADFDAEYDISDVAPSQSTRRPLRRIVIILVIIAQVVFDLLVLATVIYDAGHPRLLSPCPVAQHLYCRYLLVCFMSLSTNTLFPLPKLQRKVLSNIKHTSLTAVSARELRFIKASHLTPSTKLGRIFTVVSVRTLEG